MNTTDAASARVRIAIALSIAMHLCALWLIVALLGERQFTASSTLETSPLLAVTTIEHRAIAPTPRPIRAATSTARVPLPGPPPAAARARSTAARTVLRPRAQARRPRSLPLPERAWAASPGKAPAPPHQTIALVAPLPTATPTPMPTAASPKPSPTTQPTIAPTATPAPDVANFGGLFSQNYPPALIAPSDLARIRSRLDGPARIRIDVDETGHATDVRFLRPLSDDALAQEIRSALLALRYVPADCNGLHCDGTLELAF